MTHPPNGSWKLHGPPLVQGSKLNLMTHPLSVPERPPPPPPSLYFLTSPLPENGKNYENEFFIYWDQYHFDYSTKSFRFRNQNYVVF